MATAVRTIDSKCCPACHRKFPVTKVVDKKLAEDQAKARASIVILKDFISTNRYGLGEACRQEQVRLESALTNHKLLWAIYRRRDKATGYGIAVVRRLQKAA